jgi:hypothetical protein
MKYQAIIEYAKPKGFSDVWEGVVPNYKNDIQLMKDALVRMPPQFRKQLLLWLKKEFN